MPYVERNLQGKVVGRYACAQEGYAEEWLDDGHPDLVPLVDQNSVIKEQIVAMERKELMPRATREFMLVFFEMNLTPEQRAGNLGYVKMKAFDDQIKTLRAQLQ